MTKILLRRTGALGDVALSTIVAARLRKRFGPEARIDFQTSFPAPYIGAGWKNPDTDNVIDHSGDGYDHIVDLDGAHENRRNVHQADAYMEAAFGDHNGDKRVVLPLKDKPPFSEQIDWTRVVTIHPNSSWLSRTIPQKTWQSLATRLAKSGYIVLVLGTSIDQKIEGEGIFDTRSKMSLRDQMTAIHFSRVFVCGGSGLFTISGATDAPVVVFLTISKAEHCLPYRYGQLGYNYFPLIPKVDCYGCNASSSYQGATYVGCLRDDYACTTEFTADQAFEMTLLAMREDKRKTMR